ncbi:uncharacterized protein P174DRAFT_278894 [Aspergillus novofumigatus IBT 16806]|uniref:Uncharacterized protein n=1 Tax=Aspergillus novofumigatus (strain IBT 16806) TaxID=1392255 RepID=A0A2I1C018_ASPN1|nr:uncharacterized protein P174DRAFT_278894 [Aspergillus novofumigatus IBT 16806]PKX90951.1 hypothetical protein P174DRAFT_278894 [Aspergillus novofumigatus IBT 16806]
MIAGAKRSLAECLDTDELHSEVLYDNMYTGNDEGLGIVREHARIPALETKVEVLERQLNESKKEMMDRFSELHNTFNRLAQETDVRFSLRSANIRSRFLKRSSTREMSPLTTDSLWRTLCYTIQRALWTKMASNSHHELTGIPSSFFMVLTLALLRKSITRRQFRYWRGMPRSALRLDFE